MRSREGGSAPTRRREDPPLLRGEARYTDDISPQGTLHAAVVRSPHARARVRDVDTGRAAALDGVVDVVTAADLAADGVPGVYHTDGVLPVEQPPTPMPMLAAEAVRHAGEPVAAVVAEDRYVARDAARAVDVDYERLEPVVDAGAALADDAPLVHDGHDDNCAFDWTFGDHGAVDDAFAAAAHTVSLDLDNQRVLPDPMEPRAVLAEHDPDDGLTVWMSTQSQHRARRRLAETLGVQEHRIRVVAPAVGGGFGGKGSAPKPAESIVPWLATRLGRPVKWAATRSESHLADHPGRDVHVYGELAVDGSGRFLALRIHGRFDLGAYLVWGRTPAYHFHRVLSGQYAIPVIAGRLVGAYTNKTAVAPYRGAGRPEGIYAVERLVRRAASELDLDPAELRRLNLVPSDAFPYQTAVESVYHSGDYETALERALEAADYEGWRDRQREAREEGRYLGIGVSCGIENIGTTKRESARVRLARDGTVTAYCGTADHGQGHATTFAGLLADELGVPAEDVELREGDTGVIPDGTGTFASRSVAVGGSALVECARAVVEQARPVAAHRLEAAEGDLDFEEGEFRVRGAPDRSMHVREVAALAGDPDALPPALADALDGGLDASGFYEPADFAYPSATHVAVVEVDPEAGELDFLRYVTVDDCGVRLNPTIVEGQIHGGVAQGLGQALAEAVVYDDNGSMLSGSFQDYALPRAADLPEMETDHVVSPCPHTPTGAKGVGESGTTAAPPALVNAVVDALEPLGVEHVDMPVAGEAVWRAARG